MTHDELAAAFHALYAGLSRAHGLYKVRGREGKKVAGRAETVAEAVTVEKWRAHLEGKVGLGIVPIREDNTARWGAIDIDQYPVALDKLYADIQRLHLPLIVLRTKSGGAHLTCFTSDAVPASLMRTRLLEMARVLGYPSTEIFPKQTNLEENDTGNWLNMPYFDAEHTTRYAIEGDHALGAEHFLEQAHALSLTRVALERLSINPSQDFSDGPPCLQALAQQGIAQGMRNESMFAFGVYARLKHGEHWEEEFERLNNELCQPPLPAREIVTLVKSLGRKNYVYPCKRQPCVDLCNKDVCKTREFGVKQPGIDELDIMLGTLHKVNHKDVPTWSMEVDGTSIELSTEQLMNQNAFHRACIERIHKWPILVKPQIWKQMLSERLAHVEVIEPPDDSSEEGRLFVHLEQWLATTALARSRDELLQGKPWTEDDGITYFRSIDLMEYLDRHHFRGMPQRRVWEILRTRGAVARQVHIKGRCVRAWGLKADEFLRQTEPHDVPQIDTAEF